MCMLNYTLQCIERVRNCPLVQCTYLVTHHGLLPVHVQIPAKKKACMNENVIKNAGYDTMLMFVYWCLKAKHEDSSSCKYSIDFCDFYTFMFVTPVISDLAYVKHSTQPYFKAFHLSLS